MKRKLLIAIGIIGLAITINSCDSEENAVPRVGVPANCDTSGMTYSTGAGAIQVIINTQCATTTSCHSYGAPKSQGDFSSWSSPQLQLAISGGTTSNMYQYLQPSYSTPMPQVPQAGWSTCDRLQLEAWLADGAPQ